MRKRFIVTVLAAVLVVFALGFALGWVCNHTPPVPAWRAEIETLKDDVAATRRALEMIGGARDEHTIDRLDAFSEWLDDYERRKEASNVRTGPVPETAVPGGRHP